MINATQVLSAIDDIESQETVESTISIFSDFVGQYGFSSVVFGQMVNPVLVKEKGNNIFETTWPEEWLAKWWSKDYILNDPIAKFTIQTRRPFSWKQAYNHANKVGQKILNEGRNFDLNDGLAFPIKTGLGPIGCVSLSAEKLDLSPKDIVLMEMISIHAYMHIEQLSGLSKKYRIFHLTEREIEILHYVAEGKTNWEIGKILNLSPFSVKDHLHNIANTLNSSNRAHSVALAIRHGLIFA